MSSQYFQGAAAPAAPPPVTPADAAAVPDRYAAVPVQGMDIQAPMDESIGPAFDAANALADAGVLYAQGPRQAEAQALLESPPGAGAMNVISGYPDFESANVMPDYSPSLGTDHNPVPLPLIPGAPGV